jgi:transposase
MEEEAEIFIGLDVAKVKHAVAIAEEGRSGEVRYFGEINSDAPSVRRMVARLEKHNKRLHFAMKLVPPGMDYSGN